MATVQVIPPDRVKVTVLSTTGNFVPDPRAVETRVQLQAAGGPSSGWSGSTVACGSSGGGGGGYIEAMFTSPITLASIAVTLGVATTPGTIANPAHSPDSSFGSYLTAAGGVRGSLFATSGTEAMIGAPMGPQSNSATFGALSGTVLLDIPGGQGTGIMIPRAGDYGFIKGGDGGDSFWGTGGRSDAAIYSGSRGFISVQRNGSGYGWGAQGWAWGGTVNAYGGHVGGPARCIITEYF